MRGFNAHNPTWGGDRLDKRGEELEDLFMAFDPCVLNDGSPTHIRGVHLSLCIDITAIDSQIAGGASWTADAEKRGGDHFLISINIRGAGNPQAKLYAYFRTITGLNCIAI